ncbi:MAG: ribonuclease HI family protein [Bacteroidales bacterium]
MSRKYDGFSERRTNEMLETKRELSQVVKIYTDGAIRPDKRVSGLAAIVRNDQNRICDWWQRREGNLTCNEAEYAAACFALEQLLRNHGNKNISEVSIFSDSQVMVDQMSGRAMARAPGLRKAMKQLQSLVNQFKKVTFHHISREQNRLADALAFEAVEGLSQGSHPKQAKPNLELWEQLESSWRSQ